MSTYREIIGKKIKTVSSDPSSGTEGEMWYNSTTGTLRGPAILSAWTSSGPLISLQGDVANLGTQTASLCAGGSDNPGSENVDITQEGNGTGFSLGGTLNTARRGCAGFGTQTAGVCFGGYSTTYTNVTEEYNGTAWTNGNNTPVSPGTASWCSGGTLTAGIGYTGSYLGPPSPSNNAKQTIEYDGTNWADANQLTRTGGDGANGFGIQTAALCTGQSTTTGSPSASTLVEEYDGTNWASGTVTPTASAYGGSGGIQTAGMIFGGGSDGSPGYPTKVTTTQGWNGTSWSAEPALATARMGTQGGPVGSNTASQLMGGSNGSTNLTNVENFDSSLNTITAAAWASAASMNTARMNLGGAYGTTTAGLVGGGLNTSNEGIVDSEEFNGTGWTEGPNMNTARGALACCGTQTAALGAGGYDAPGPTGMVATEEYDGSTWANGGDLSQEVYGGAGFGTQTAGVKAGGYNNALPPGNVTTQTEEYNGSAWGTNPNGLGTARYAFTGSGTSTAGLVVGGYQYTGPPPAHGATTATEEFDGTNWTTGGALNIKRSQMGCSGNSQTACIIFAGNATPSYSPYASGFTEGYDGTSWSTRPSMATGRTGVGGSYAGTTTAAFAAGGRAASPPAALATVEEFTGETSAATAKTLTTS